MKLANSIVIFILFLRYATMANCRSVRFLSGRFLASRPGKVKTSRGDSDQSCLSVNRLEDDKSLLQESVLVVDEAQKLFFALEQFFTERRNIAISSSKLATRY